MAKKNKIDFKELSTDDVLEKIKEETTRLQKLKFNHVISPVENPKIIGIIRKDIARMKTELQKRKMTQTVKK